MSRSISYHQHLIEFLSDPKIAAAYLEDIIQDNEGEPRLLSLGLKNVAEALGQLTLSDEEIKKHQEKINDILNSQGFEVIENLEQWLNFFGLKLSVTVREDSQNNQLTKENLEETMVKLR